MGKGQGTWTAATWASQVPMRAWPTVLPPPLSLTILSQRYVPPDQVKGPAYTKGSASTPIQGSVPEGKPLRTLLGDPVPSLPAAASTSSQVTLNLPFETSWGLGDRDVSFLNPARPPHRLPSLDLADDSVGGVSSFSALLSPMSWTHLGLLSFRRKNPTGSGI